MAAVSEETRRLQKALRARDKWQKKCEFEREVNLELARRIEHWKEQTQKERSAREVAEKAFVELYTAYLDITDRFESLALLARSTDAAAATIADLRRLRDWAHGLRSQLGVSSTHSSRLPSPSPSASATQELPSHRSARSYSGVSHLSSDTDQPGTRMAKAASFHAPEVDVVMQLQDDAKDPLKIRRASKIKRRRSSVTHRRGDTVDLASTITGLSGSSLHRHTNSATTHGTSEEHAPVSPIYNVDTLSFTIDGEEGEDEDDDDDDNDVVEGVPLFEQFVVVGPEPAAAREAHMDKLVEFHSAAGLMKKFGRMLSKERDSDAADIRAIAQPKVLFRYPNISTPLPDEICDFCQPVGAVVQQIAGQDTSTLLQDIMYGHGHTQRNPHCFVFQLTGSEASGGATEQRISEETGQNVGRLYGICVVHPRLIKATTVRESYNADGRSVYSQSPKRPVNVHQNEDYEASVCYAFITRFPFFEFFFQVIWDMLSAERLQRMEAVALHGDMTDYDQQVYEYLPTESLRMIAGRLHEMLVPKYGGKLFFQVTDALDPINYLRLRPDPDMSEQLLAASEWALPTMFSWLPVPVLIWSMSLLLCEAKFVVIGQEPGLVSSVVFGLLSLLRPLRWVAPLIPVLPLKFLEFLESPVPILAGLVVDKSMAETTPHVPGRKAIGPQAILRRARDSGSVTAVLDVNKQDLFVSMSDLDEVTNMLMYDAAGLYQRLDQEYTRIFGRRTPSRETYTFTRQEKSDMRELYDIINKHMRGVLRVADQHLKHRDAAPVQPQRSSEEELAIVLSEHKASPKPIAASPIPPPSAAYLHSPHMRSSSTAMSRNSSHRSESESGTGEPAIIGLALEELTGDEHSFLEKAIATQMFDEHVANRARKSGRFSLPSPKHGKRVSAALTAPIEFTDAQLAGDRSREKTPEHDAKELELHGTMRSAASDESIVFAHLTADQSAHHHKRRSRNEKDILRRLSADLRDSLQLAGSSSSDHIAPAELYRRER